MKHIESLARIFNLQNELSELYSDFNDLSNKDFYKKHKKWLLKFYDKDDVFYILDDEKNRIPTLTFYFLVAHGYFAMLDWSSEVYVGQVKSFITRRLKKLGVTPIKINDKKLQNAVSAGEIRRDEYLPLLLKICHKHLKSIGYSIAICDLRSDEILFTVVKIEESSELCALVDDYYEFDTPTTFDLYLEFVNKEGRTKMMMYLKKIFSVDNATAKNMIDNLPIKVATGLKSDIDRKIKSIEAIAKVGLRVEINEEDDLV